MTLLVLNIQTLSVTKKETSHEYFFGRAAITASDVASIDSLCFLKNLPYNILFEMKCKG